jgi:hypothetical protein
LAPVERCTNHTFEIADRLCGECGRPFCGMCLVKPFRRRPPICHQCAVAAAGIRKGARPAPVRSRKEIKAFERERRQEEVRTDPAATPAPERGFGPAKPALSSRPKPAAQPQPQPPQSKDADTDAEDGDEARPDPVGRNRPLRGLAR